MTSTPRRSGFRLPWSADAEEKTDTATAGEATTDDAPATPHTDAAAPETATQTERATEPEPAATPSAQAAALEPKPVETKPAETTSTPADPFLQDLVQAMRRVAEEARDKNLSELRTLVEKRVEQAGDRAAERAEDLRRRSELDIKGIGDWERSELERVRTEAERKVEARRKQLEQQLHDHQESTERDVADVRTRLADHERELDAFFAQLSEIKDPGAFVSAAKRMPSPPALDARTTADAGRFATRADPDSLTSRLAMLGIDKDQPPEPASVNGTTTSASEASATQASETERNQPASATLEERLAQLDEQLQPAAETPAAVATARDATGEVSTAIVVKGLGSFGAITSFKQSLEKVEGIKSVTLSLGPTGEFVYRAAHDASFDLEGVIATLEGGSAELERQSDNTLRVTVTRSR